MNLFELTLHRKVEGICRVVVERSALPLPSEGELALKEEEMQLLQQDAKAYGQMLGESLFRDAVRDAVAQARSETESSVRVLLNVERTIASATLGTALRPVWQTCDNLSALR